MMYEELYCAALSEILDIGEWKTGRNGRTKGLFNISLHADLSASFPAITARKLHLPGIIGEYCAFISGTKRLALFKEFGCNYWDTNAKAWAHNKGVPENLLQVGNYVGALWRNFEGHDQLAALVSGLHENPNGRRHVLTAWHPTAPACLPPCTVMAIFYHVNGKLSCHVTQRSADMCLGVPSDFVVYGLLVHALCKELGMQPDILSFSLIDAHIYEEHIPAANELLERYNSVPYSKNSAPTLKLEERSSFFEPAPRDFKVENYEPLGPLNFPFIA